MSILQNQPLDMTSGETYECPHCRADILTYNQATHDAICSRRNAAGNQRSARPQQIRRENSSSGQAEPVETTQPTRRPQVREDRNIASNKLITCPNCDKSVREQSLNSHIAHECEGNDKIPCEFCNKAIPMSVYTQHVDDAHRREREQEQERHLERTQQQQQPSQPRQRSAERVPSPNREEVQNNQGQSPSEQRDRPAEQENSGGFMGFIRGLVQSATQNRSEPQQEERPREVERHLPSEQPQSGSRSLLARLLGVPQEHDHEERHQHSSMEDFFLRALQGGQQRESQNPFTMQQQQQQPRSRVRTIRLGPHGTLIVSNGRGAVEDEEPEDVWQSVGAPPRRRVQSNFGMGPQSAHSIDEMGPMGLLLQMLAARGQGMPMAFNFSPEQISEIEQKGLSKEDIESLSVMRYEADKNKNLSEDMKSCPICLEEFETGSEVKFLWCLHRFHKKCIDQWLDKNTNCPICKKDFSEMNEGNFAEGS